MTLNNLPDFDNAALFTMLKENSHGHHNGAEGSAHETARETVSEDASRRDQESMIDPELTSEGRGNTP
jgi:hypothetical protein